MPEQPFEFNPTDLKAAIQQMKQVLDDMFNERLAGAREGDVLQIDNNTDILTLTLAAAGGLRKLAGALAILCDPDGPMILSSDGLDIMPVSITKKGAAPILSNVVTQFLNGQGGWTVPSGAYTDEIIQDLIGAMVTGNTETGIAVTYDDGNAKFDFNAQTAGDLRYEQLSNKDAASGYAGLNASSRTTKGVDTTDDIIVDLATKGLVLKDAQGTPHYWRVTISNVGAIITSDLGTGKP
jgi:hypothetical protein